MFKIGTLADWFNVGLINGIKESEKCGASGVQIYAANELDPSTATRELIELTKKTAKDCGQKVTALCGELGGYGLEKREEHKEKLDYLKKVIELADFLECPVITTHIGVVPKEKTHPRYQIMLDGCGEIGHYASRYGITIAVETGPEAIATLRGLVDDCGKGVGINYDPANLVMVGTDDEVTAVQTAGSAIVHTHAKDGKLIHFLGGEEFYHNFAEGGLEWAASAHNCEETPLGEGSVRWPEYLKALQDVGYDGYLTIEREVKNGADDIRMAVRFLNEQIAKL